MKMSIKWHEECFNNAKSYYENELRRATEQLEKVRRAYDDLQLYESQIVRAKADGKESFDRERYGVKNQLMPK